MSEFKRSAKMKTLILFTLCLLASHLGAEERARPKEFFDPDVQRLVKVGMFAFGGVGFGGQTSDGEAAFGAVVRKKEAIRYIMAVFEYGSAHAQCYALVALRESSPELFRESMARMRKNPPKEIAVMSGCIMSHVSPKELFDAIEAGHYSDWFKHYEEKG